MMPLGLKLAMLSVVFFVAHAVLLNIAPLLPESLIPEAESGSPPVLPLVRRGIILAAGGLLVAGILLSLKALEAFKAGMLGSIAAVCAAVGVVLLAVGIAGIPLPFHVPVPSMGFLLAAAALYFFSLERFSDNSIDFKASTGNARPAAILLAVLALVVTVTAGASFSGSGGGSGPYTVRTRFGGTRTVSGRGIDLPPQVTGPLLALACAGLGVHCFYVLASFRRAVDNRGGAPDNVPLPANPGDDPHGRPDHIRRSDDPPRPPQFPPA